MKKLTVFTLLLTILFAFLGCKSKSTSDNSLNDIKKKSNFVLGLDDTFPPMGFRDQSGDIVGFDIDLAKEVAKRMGVEIKLKPVEWNGVILSLNNKDIDLIWNGMTITEERKEKINFSKPYLDNRQIIIVLNKSTISGKADLAKKIIGLQMGSSSENALASDEELSKAVKEVKKYSNNAEALLDLEAERVDAVIVDEIVGRYYISKKADSFKVLDDDLGHEIYGVGFRKSDISFMEEVNKILDEMKKDGTTKLISEKWFGSDIVTM